MAKRVDDGFQILENRVSELFTPSAPIDTVDLFAGRWNQLQTIKDVVLTKGLHGILYGERGVGKTSLVSVLAPLLKIYKLDASIVVRQNCTATDTFGRAWKRSLSQMVSTARREKIELAQDVLDALAPFGPNTDREPSPDDVIAILREVEERLVFIFDEYDVLPREAKIPFGDTVKALSDYAVRSTVLLVGVGDDVGSLIEAHSSVERALTQIHMPRMTDEELGEAIDKVAEALKIGFDPDAAERIVDFSQGLPHYVHLLGLYSTRAAIQRTRAASAPTAVRVTLPDVEKGVATAASRVPQSLLDAYQNAVDSPQRDSLFKEVLLACALTAPDDRGSFAASDVRGPLREMTGRELDISAFAPHLKKFASKTRGCVLQMVGQPRRYRYRFREPLMQPYVVMRGLSEGLIDDKRVQKLKVAQTGGRSRSGNPSRKES